MIFDNYCSAAQRQDILDRFTALSARAGANYNADYKPVYGSTPQARDAADAWEAHYKHVFDSQEAMRSPRDEFIMLLSDAINGWDFDYAPAGSHGKGTILQQKDAIVRAVANDIQPHADVLSAFVDAAGGWGTGGQHPYDVVTRIEKLDRAWAVATAQHDKAAKKRIIAYDKRIVESDNEPLIAQDDFDYAQADRAAAARLARQRAEKSAKKTRLSRWLHITPPTLVLPAPRPTDRWILPPAK